MMRTILRQIAIAAAAAGLFVALPFGASQAQAQSVQLAQAEQDQTEGIKEVQRQLQALGLYSGAIDGIVGPATRSAWQQFTRAAGVGPEMTEATWRLLLEAAAIARTLGFDPNEAIAAARAPATTSTGAEQGLDEITYDGGGKLYHEAHGEAGMDREFLLQRRWLRGEDTAQAHGKLARHRGVSGGTRRVEYSFRAICFAIDDLVPLDVTLEDPYEGTSSFVVDPDRSPTEEERAAYNLWWAACHEDFQKFEPEVVVAAPDPPASSPATVAPPEPLVVTSDRRVALVIGNSDYQAVPRLPNPVRDAAAIAHSLERLGFTDVQHLTDLSKAEMERALLDFSELAIGADWAVVYFAGHGIEMDGRNYLIPVDAQLRQDRHVRLETVSLDDVLESAGAAGGLRLVILDACRDNPFIARMSRTDATRSIGRGLARVEPDGGTLIAYAARAGQVALDGEGDNSPFVAALVEHLSEPGLEIGRLFRRVRADVLGATGGRQEPFTYGSLPDEDFYFVAREVSE